MDHNKTGALIAQRRNQLGLTQKQLAEKLNISDRTVSKWERGAGFPDISLIEPLADTLGLTLLELFHGEENTSTPEDDCLVRETLNTIKPELNKTIKKSRQLAITLTFLLVISLSVLIWVVNNSIHGKWVSMENITATEATSISPYILITDQDRMLLETLRHDEAVSQYISSDNTEIKTITLDKETADAYIKMINQQDINSNFLIIQVLGEDIYLFYGNDYINYTLGSEENFGVSKTITTHKTPYRTENGLTPPSERKVIYHLENTGNLTFRRSVHNNGILSLFDNQI